VSSLFVTADGEKITHVEADYGTRVRAKTRNNAGDCVEHYYTLVHDDSDGVLLYVQGDRVLSRP
jgi:hypothetical protein